MAHTDFIVFRATCELSSRLDFVKVSASLTIKRPFTKTVELSFSDEYYPVLGSDDFTASGLPSHFESLDRHNARGHLKDLSHFAAEFTAWAKSHDLDSAGFEEYPHAMRKAPFPVGGTIQEGYHFLLAREL